MNRDEDLLDELLSKPKLVEVLMFSTARVNDQNRVNAEKLSNIWRIDKETAERTFSVKSQNFQRVDEPSLKRNYSANDRMLRCKRIDTHFFIDTFFATKKAKKSSRGNACCQLFVADKVILKRRCLKH